MVVVPAEATIRLMPGAPTTDKRTTAGASIVEVGAAMVIFIPLIVMLFFLIQEVSYAYLITSNLDEAARRAARQLAIDYGQDPVNTPTPAHESAVFSAIRIAHFVATNTQFSAQFQTAATPRTVTVVVSYPPDGIPGSLPAFSDPLHLGIARVVPLTSQATSALE